MKNGWSAYQFELWPLALCVQMAVNAAFAFHLFSEDALSVAEKLFYICLLVSSFIILLRKSPINSLDEEFSKAS